MDVFVDVFTGLFFQDAMMKYNFNCFPEVFFFMLLINLMNFGCHCT